MPKLLQRTLLLLAFALVAAACSPNDSTPATTGDSGGTTTTADATLATEAPTTEAPTTEAPPEVDPDVRVKLTIPSDLGGYLPQDAVNAAFSEKFPNIELVPGTGFWAGADEAAFLTAAATESVNDVLTAGDEHPDIFGPRGIYLDLRPFLEKDADLWYDDARFANWWIYENPDGAIYSVPLGGNPMVVWYNPELFAEAGLDLPPTRYDDPAYVDWTWEKFTDYAETLSGVATWGVGIENNILLYGPLAASNGGALINDDASEYLIDDPAVVETLEFLTSFTLNGLSPEPSGAQDLGGVDSLFQAGEIAMWIGGGWNTGAYFEADLGFTPRMATLPHNGVQTGIVTCPAGRFGISAFYDNPEAAYEYLKFVVFDVWDTDVITSTTEFSPWSNVYSRIDVWNDIMATGDVLAGAYGPDKQDLSFLTNDACGKEQMLANPPWYGPMIEVRDITLGEMDLVFSGEQSLTDAVTAIKDQADSVITRFNRGS